MSKRVAKSIKEKVAKRACNCCEYCLLPERVSFYKFHIEHIRSLKHGGTSNLDNLAYGCPDCNAFKGSDDCTLKKATPRRKG
jgi:5-methylcytosine-specific restriction endonuclease McrA